MAARKARPQPGASQGKARSGACRCLCLLMLLAVVAVYWQKGQVKGRAAIVLAREQPERGRCANADAHAKVLHIDPDAGKSMLLPSPELPDDSDSEATCPVF